jgi:Na+/proline symporter
MSLHPLDIAVVAAYAVAMVAIGFWAERRASRNVSGYFLGGNRMPWWLLSLSNATTMFDISGTMWLVSLLFVYGLRSVFIPWLWPVFNQIFLMVYLSSWVRRSKVLTGGEWITLRFGDDRGAEASRLSVVLFALVSVIGFTSYAFIGVSKFAAVFLPPWLSPNAWGVVIVAITTLYTVMGGFYSVVLTDVVQFFLKTIACVAIGAIAMSRVPADVLHASVPATWGRLWPGVRLDLDWSQLLPSVQGRIAHDGYALFGAFLGMTLFKGVLVSAAGPAPNYDMQRILAARSPREASLMSGFVSLVLFLPRFFLIAGIAVLALAYLRPAIAAQGAAVDFEQVLPLVIRNFVPTGIAGILIAGFLAAFMSTFAGTINAAAAYLVNDVYKRYVAPDATERRLIQASWLASSGVVIVGCGIGCFMTSINSITMWIVSALWGGYAAPNLLKWHWWRLNGWGYLSGMLTGIGGALLLALFPSLPPLMAFPLLFACSAAGAIVGSLATQPQDSRTLKAFYRRTNPWGVWGPIRAQVILEHKTFRPNRDLPRDALNVLVGIVWQTALVALPIYVVIHDARGVVATLSVASLCTIFLKRFWLDRLGSSSDETATPPSAAEEVQVKDAIRSL